MSYNERNELTQKKIGNTSGSSYLQTIDYQYNIRKWLTAINDVDNLGSDLFSMKLDYLGNNENYNGNISTIEWNTPNNTSKKVYDFVYDDLNRLTASLYSETTNNSHTARYNTSYAYDKNGNIKSLGRNGMYADGTFGQIDLLAYDYDNEGRLTTLGETKSKDAGFKSITNNGSGDYTYDDNGNMTSDEHKGITVTYNYLNLPEKVIKADGSSIQWLYDAAGNKLQKTVVATNLAVNDNPILSKEYKAAQIITSTGTIISGSNVIFTAGQKIELNDGFSSADYFLAQIQPNTATEVRDYLGGIEYLNSIIEAVYFSGGRVKYEGGNTEYEYVLSDYQGNTRVLFKDNGGTAEVVEDYSGYYPFGALHQEQGDYSQKYLFGGKELQTELDLGWSDFGTRCLDNWSGKWLGVDILAEAKMGVSPYAYGLGNPVRFSDPTGMLEEDENGIMSVSTSLWGRDVTGGENSGQVGREVRADTQERKPGNSNNKNGNWTANIDDKGNISYSAGEGDNFTTFAKQFGVESAWDIFTKEENEAAFNNIYPKNARWGKKKFAKGETLKTDRVYSLILSDNTSIQSVYNQQEFMSNYLYFYGLETFNLNIFFDVRSTLGLSIFDGIVTSKGGIQFQFTAEFGLTGRRIFNSPPQSGSVGLNPFFGNYKFYSPEDKNWGPRIIFSRKNGYPCWHNS